jgi:hypothetical protein
MVTELGPAKIEVELDTSKISRQIDAIRRQVEGMQGGRSSEARGPYVPPPMPTKYIPEEILESREEKERARERWRRSEGAGAQRPGARGRRRGGGSGPDVSKGSLRRLGKGLGKVGAAGAAVATGVGIAYAATTGLELLTPMLGEMIRKSTEDTVFDFVGEKINEKMQEVSDKITGEVTSTMMALFPAAKKTMDLERAKYLLGGKDVGPADVALDFATIYEAEKAMTWSQRQQRKVIGEQGGGIAGTLTKRIGEILGDAYNRP